ncbi:MAG: hypothetical protein ACI8UD_000032 [Planctomycetota bacterium]|jgi:hypothetical protein
MTQTITLIACLAFAGALLGQDSALTTARVEYKAMKADYDSAMDAYYMATRRVSASPAYKKAREENDKDAMRELRAAVVAPDKKAWTVKFEKAASRYEPAAGEVPFLGWVALWSANKKAATKSVEAILDRHADSVDLLEVAEYIGVLRRAVGEELHGKVLDKLLVSKHAMVKANALFSKGYSMVATRGLTPSAEDLSKGKELLAECARLAPGTELALRANAPEFEKTRLQVGMKVPDIVGQDLAGVPFKLSDYRGKVVVIDFWGDW